MVLALVTIPVFVTLGKLELHNVLRLLRSKGHGTRNAVIVGAGPLGRRIYSALLRSPKFGIDPVAFVDDDPQTQSRRFTKRRIDESGPPKCSLDRYALNCCENSMPERW